MVAVLLGLSTLSTPADVNVGIRVGRVYGFSYDLRVSLTVSNETPTTYHRVESPSGFAFSNSGIGNGGSTFFITNNLGWLLHEATNGLWKLYRNVGHASEELYQFKVNVSGVDSNLLGTVQIIYPQSGSSGIPNLPTFHFTGPSNMPTLMVRVNNGFSIPLASSVTNYTPSAALPSGANDFFIEYTSNSFPGITFTVPTNSLGANLANWSAQGGLGAYAYSDFNVTSAGGNGHTLRAHYTFEDNSIQATDFSGNGNDVTSIGSSGTGGTRYVTNNPAIGNRAAYFHNNGGLGSGFLIAPDSLFPTLSGSFTVSLWVQTTQVSGNDTDAGFSNAGLISTFSGGGDAVRPMVLTGRKLGFYSGGFPGGTLHSAESITNANGFVHVVVTRNQANGEKKIYVNGELDASSTGSTSSFAITDLFIGWNGGPGFQGVMDEIQFYSGVLSDAEVEFLYNTPGSTVPDTGGSPLGEAVDAPQLSWTTGGDAEWFPQTDESNDGIDAAQSGAIDHDQESWIETTVQGPGWFSFYWNVSSDDSDGYDYLEFTVDGFYESEISGEWGWDYYEIYLEEGEHTLRWTYYKDSEFTAGVDAAWLDEVNFQAEVEIGISLQIGRNTTPGDSGFFAYPYLNYYAPEPLTSHEIESPTGLFSAYVSESEEYGSYSTQPTLEAVIDELEAGPWTLYINRGHPSERQFTFFVTATDLDVSDLPAVNITSPMEGEEGIATNHVFTWTGPTGFDSLFMSSYLHPSFDPSGGNTNLPIAATSSMTPNPLAEGTNLVSLYYSLHGFEGVEITEPTDGGFNNLSSWSYDVSLQVYQGRKFVVGGSAPATPVQILNPAITGNEIDFSFQTQAGRSHTVQSRTNLTTAPWINLTNFTGDGNIWQFNFPVGPAPESYFRVGTQ